MTCRGLPVFIGVASRRKLIVQLVAMMKSVAGDRAWIGCCIVRRQTIRLLYQSNMHRCTECLCLLQDYACNGAQRISTQIRALRRRQGARRDATNFQRILWSQRPNQLDVCTVTSKLCSAVFGASLWLNGARGGLRALRSFAQILKALLPLLAAPASRRWPASI